MASALIQSNAQSALISTLDSAPTAQTNPFEYSLSKRVPSHGVQITQLQPVNAGATAPGSVLNFDLIKMGFTRSLTLKLDVYHAALGDGKSLATPRTGFLNLIDHIDIESSSRRILTMSRAALIAAYSDLNHEQRMAFERGCRMTSNGKLQFPANLAANESDPIQIYIPLLFSVFDNPGLALATGFTEPIRISIKFASSYNFVKDITVDSGNGAELTAAITVNKPRLIVEHRLLPNELEDRTISELFQNGPLSQLVYDYEEETEELKTMSAAGAAGVTMSHEIRSTAVATDIYVFAECKMDQFPMDAAGTDDDDLMSALVPLYRSKRSHSRLPVRRSSTTCQRSTSGALESARFATDSSVARGEVGSRFPRVLLVTSSRARWATRASSIACSLAWTVRNSTTQTGSVSVN